MVAGESVVPVRVSSAEKALLAGGVGAVAMVFGAPQAHAAFLISAAATKTVVLSNTAQLATLAGPYKMVYLSIDGVPGYDFSLTAWSGGPGGGKLGVAVGNGVAGSGPFGKAFSKTSSINASLGGGAGTWLASSFGRNVLFMVYSTTLWQSSAYLGYRVNTAGSYSYHWIQLSAVTSSSYNLAGWGAVGSGGGGGGSASSGGGGESTGTPEPAAGGLGLLALGAAGVLRRRRQGRAA